MIQLNNTLIASSEFLTNLQDRYLSLLQLERCVWNMYIFHVPKLEKVETTSILSTKQN